MQFLHKTAHFEFQRPMQKRWKDYNNQRWWLAARKHCLPDNRTHAHMNAQRLWLHAQGLRMFKSDGVTELRRGSRHTVTPLSKTLFAFDNAGKGKNNFLQWSNTGFINHPPVQVQCTGVVAQHKMDSIIFFLERECF